MCSAMSTAYSRRQRPHTQPHRARHITVERESAPGCFDHPRNGDVVDADQLLTARLRRKGHPFPESQRLSFSSLELKAPHFIPPRG